MSETLKVGDVVATDKGDYKVKRVIQENGYEIYECSYDGQTKYLNNKNGYIDDNLSEAKSSVRMSRKLSEVSKDIQTANFDESGHSQAEPKKGADDKETPEKGAPTKDEVPATEGVIKATPAVADPVEKTPADMQNSPDAYLPEDEVTGD